MRIEYAPTGERSTGHVLLPLAHLDQAAKPTPAPQAQTPGLKKAVATYLAATSSAAPSPLPLELHKQLQRSEALHVALGHLPNHAGPLYARAATFHYARRTQRPTTEPGLGFFAHLRQLALDGLQQPQQAAELELQAVQAQALANVAQAATALEHLLLEDWPAWSWVGLSSLLAPLACRGKPLRTLTFAGGVLGEAPPANLQGLAAFGVEKLALRDVRLASCFFSDLLDATGRQLGSLELSWPRYKSSDDAAEEADDALLIRSLVDLVIYLGQADEDGDDAPGQAAPAAPMSAWPPFLLQLPLVPLPHLTRLQLHGCKFDVALLASKQLPRLQELELHSGWFGEAPVEALARGAWSQLVHLSCFRMRSSTTPSARSLDLHLVAPSFFPALKRFTFSANGHGFRRVAASAKALMAGELAALEVLDLRGTPLSHLRPAILAVAFRSLPTTLVVDQGTLSHKQQQLFARCVPLAVRSLKHRRVDDDGLRDAGYKTPSRRRAEAWPRPTQTLS